MEKDLIFYSEEEEQDFLMENEKLDLDSVAIVDQDRYLASLLSSKNLFHHLDPPSEPQPIFCQIKEKAQSKGKSKTDQHSQTELPESFNSMQNQWDRNQDSQFVPDRMDMPTKGKSKKKKDRPSDQNICKKYHTFANKCLRGLKIYKHISPFIEKIHKRNYFIIALIISEKCNKLDQFTESYYQKVKEESLKCEKSLKNCFNGSLEYKKKKQLLKAIMSSLKAIDSYKNGSIQDAVYNLYDVERMKRQAWVQQAYIQVLQLSKNLLIF